MTFALPTRKSFYHLIPTMDRGDPVSLFSSGIKQNRYKDMAGNFLSSLLWRALHIHSFTYSGTMAHVEKSAAGLSPTKLKLAIVQSLRY
jgi:hypothetical protein